MDKRKTIAILGTLDTKGEEVAFMKELIEDRGCSAMIIDVGPLGPPGLQPDVTNKEVAREAGWDLSKLVGQGERDLVMEVMGKGAAAVLQALYSHDRIDGVIALGGNQGSAIASMAMRSLPFGFPKYLVSTVASGNIRPYVGCKDIGVVFSVGDFLGGPNPVTSSVLANAVAAVVGMAEHGREVAVEPNQRVVAVTALGNTEPAATEAVRLLKAKGFQVVPFHASGAGGSAMEELVEKGIIHGVLDLTPHELSEEIVGFGAYVPVRPGRLTAAGSRGIPQVVSTGGMEYLCFGPWDSIPLRLRKRKICMHNPYNANVKVSRKEMGLIGKSMAERLNQAKGPVAVLVPLGGWSIYGANGGPLYDEAGYRVFLNSLRTHLRAEVKLEQIHAHINDSIFVNRCVEQLAEFLEQEER